MRRPERIYKRVEFIGATKGPRSESAYPGQKFKHTFSSKPEAWALPRARIVTPGGTFKAADGSALITSRLTRVNPPKHLHRRISGERWFVNPPKKRKRNPLLTVIGANPPRRFAMFGNLVSVDNVKKVAAAGVGAVASASLPAMVLGADVSTGKAYLAQAVIAVGGAWAVGRFVSQTYSLPWLLGAGVGAVQDPIRRAVARTYGAVTGVLNPAPAMGAYMYEDSPTYLGRGLSYYGGRPLGPVPALGMGRYTNVTRGI